MNDDQRTNPPPPCPYGKSWCNGTGHYAGTSCSGCCWRRKQTGERMPGDEHDGDTGRGWDRDIA